MLPFLLLLFDLCFGQEETTVSCSIDEIRVQIGSFVESQGLAPIALGTCPTSSANFLENNTVVIPNFNVMQTWEYDCGFIRTENATNVIFTNELVLVENESVNPYGIMFAQNFDTQSYRIGITLFNIPKRNLCVEHF